ncbi:MAG: hypothetical protein QXR26_03635 [Candidatus Caldarchaeum sp.]
MSLEEGLRKLLQGGRDWQRVPVKGSPGLFVVKAPAYRGRPASLIVEINPVGEDGAPTKRRGLMLRSRSELEAFRQLLSNKKLDTLMDALEKVNPKTEGSGEEELEI